jgi:hypothetical protein
VFTILCVGVSIRICTVLYYVIFCFFIFLLRIGEFDSVFVYSIGVGVYSIAGVTCIRIEIVIMLVLLLVVRAGASLGFFGVLSPRF